MQFIMQRVSINISKEKRIAYNAIKMAGINEGGLVYGGLVRDEIIAKYNKTLFDDYVKSIDLRRYEKYWDSSFHPESSKRLLIPDDMDIYFKNNDLSDAFIAKIREYASSFNGNVIIHNVVSTAGLFYVLGNNFAHKIVKIVIRSGRTLSFAGHKVELKIDIIINLTDREIEPPFNCADFTSNLFVMAKTSQDHYEIRLSNNTGTSLDEMSFVAKRRVEMKIIEDMIEGKTEFIRNVESINSEYINGSRILKMLSKTLNHFQITNLLFKEVSISPCTQNCDICLEMISVDSPGSFIEILTNKHACNIMHYKCFISYLTKEVTNRYVNPETHHIACRCPRRNYFNFKDSFRYSTLYK